MRLRRLVVAAAVGTASISGATFAWAAFSDTETASQSLDTATLEPPTNVQLSAGTCIAGVADSVIVSWTMTPSTWADGYEVLGSLLPEGPYLISQQVSGRNTESAVASGLAFQTTYHFVVKSSKGNWRSAPTTVVSRTTRSALCL